MPTFRENVTDIEQTKVEVEAFDNGAPVFEDQTTRVIVAARGGASGVSSSNGASVASGNSAGVIRPFKDHQNRFMGELVGRA